MEEVKAHQVQNVNVSKLAEEISQNITTLKHQVRMFAKYPKLKNSQDLVMVFNKVKELEDMFDHFFINFKE